jgi:sulfur carrier protein
MRLNINGAERVCGCRDLADLWRAETAELDLPNPKGFAIALNGVVVRREAWAATALNDGDRVEIIRAMQGG